jgi:ATP-dependent Lon protease
MTTKENENITSLPIVPLRNSVFFPGAIMPLTVGREKTVKLIEDAVRENKYIGIVSQHKPEIGDPTPKDVYRVGTLAKIIKVAKTDTFGYNIVVEGVSRFSVKKFEETEPYFVAKVEVIEGQEVDEVVMDLMDHLQTLASEVMDLLPDIPMMAKQLLESIDTPGHLADLITANIEASIDEKQEVLEATNLTTRLSLVISLLEKQAEVLKISEKINSQVRGEMSKTQREYYLRQQMKVIKEELNEYEEGDDLVSGFIERARKANLPDEAQKIFDKEIEKLKNIQPSQAEYNVARSYVETILEMPWAANTIDSNDLEEAQGILDDDHYGLEKVKKRIIEYLAVRKLKDDMKGPILCLLGPPGVGKTSLGKSIATALGRKFHRISLGGVKDESEIRGHRRTYVGALPGRILQGLKKVGVNNPVFLLDEIDKMSSDYRGDPSSAMLEVLDPEQNDTFSDHYLEMDFDLSSVLFIATANSISGVPLPLRDRMEIIELSGYTHEEKLQIAKRHLIKQEMEKHGVEEETVNISDEVIQEIIEKHTREAGVRGLKRQMAAVSRYIAVQIAKELEEKVTITSEKLEEVLGPQKFENEVAERTSKTGVATGLAWTAVGGDLLFIETTKMPGKGKLSLTGKLGEVMSESANTALSLVRSRAKDWGLGDDEGRFMEEEDFHVHFPAGATPKDGPSAGITITTALVSLLTGKKVNHEVAMTGEITLRGLVLPVGGIKEKVLAAHRGGIKKILMPAKNEKDLVDVPDVVKEEVEFVFVKEIGEVLEHAFVS